MVFVEREPLDPLIYLSSATPPYMTGVTDWILRVPLAY
jgi:hypothetical protein